MYEVFGEMSTAAEINAVARSLKEEKELDNLKVLAKENGIEEVFAEMFYEGEIPYLTDDSMAAVAKLEAEAKELDSQVASAVSAYLQGRCDDIEFARAVRKKGKSLKTFYEDTIKRLREEARKKKKNAVCIEYPRKKLFREAEEYYMEGRR